MQSAKNGEAEVPSEGQEDNFCLIVSDLVSLIDHVQASIKLIESAKARDDAGDQEFADIVVLDDITPLYARASAALDACNLSLSTALKFLLDTKTTRLAD